MAIQMTAFLLDTRSQRINKYIKEYKYNKIVSRFGFKLRILWQYIDEENRGGGDDSYITCWSLHWKSNTVLPETENMKAFNIQKNSLL